METPSEFTYNLDGSRRKFSVPVTIKGDEYCRVEVNGVAIGDKSLYDIVNNYVVFHSQLPILDSGQLRVRVVQSAEAIGDLGGTLPIDVSGNLLNLGVGETTLTDRGWMSATATNRIASIWDNSESQFALVYTDSSPDVSDVNITGYADLRLNQLTAAIVGATTGSFTTLSASSSTLGAATASSLTSGSITSTGTLQGSTLSVISSAVVGSLSSEGSITGTDITASGNLSADVLTASTTNGGAISGTSIISSGTLQGNTVIGNTISGQTLSATVAVNSAAGNFDNLTTEDSATFNNDVTINGNLTVNEIFMQANTINAESINAEAGIFSNNVQAPLGALNTVQSEDIETETLTLTSTLTGVTGNFSGALTAQSLTTAGNINGASISGSSLIGNTVTATSNVSSPNAYLDLINSQVITTAEANITDLDVTNVEATDVTSGTMSSSGDMTVGGYVVVDSGSDTRVRLYNSSTLKGQLQTSGSKTALRALGGNSLVLGTGSDLLTFAGDNSLATFNIPDVRMTGDLQVDGIVSAFDVHITNRFGVDNYFYVGEEEETPTDGITVIHPSASSIQITGTEGANSSLKLGQREVGQTATVNYLNLRTIGNTDGNRILEFNSQPLDFDVYTRIKWKIDGTEYLKLQPNELQLITPTATDPVIRMLRGGTDVGSLQGHHDGAALYGSQVVKLVTGGVEGARLDSARKFLINRTSANGSTALQVAGGAYFTDYIGMGTSVPRSPLHIHTPTADNSFIRFTNISTGNGVDDGATIGMSANTKKLRINAPSGESVDIQVGGVIYTSVTNQYLDVFRPIRTSSWLDLNGQGFIRGDFVGYVTTQGGVSGTRFMNNNGSMDNMVIRDNGDVVTRKFMSIGTSSPNVESITDLMFEVVASTYAGSIMAGSARSVSSGAAMGNYSFAAYGNATGHKRIAMIEAYTDGGSGNTMGGGMAFRNKLAGSTALHTNAVVTNQGVWEFRPNISLVHTYRADNAYTEYRSANNTRSFYLQGGNDSGHKFRLGIEQSGYFEILVNNVQYVRADAADTNLNNGRLTVRGQGDMEASIKLYRQSNGNGVGLGSYIFRGNNANNSAIDYSRIQGQIDDNTTGSERGTIDLEVLAGGGSWQLVGRARTNGMNLYSADKLTSALVVNNTGSGPFSAMIAEFQTSGTTYGNIQINGSTCQFNSTSDYRLKENLQELSDIESRFMKLKPTGYNFIAHPDIYVEGFIAHEVQEVVPQAVQGEKDGERMQTMDQGQLIPLTIAMVQKLVKRVEELELQLTI